LRREIGEAAGVQHVIGREREDLAGGPIDAHPRADRETVPLDPRLKLLVPIVREADRVTREEHRRQREVERKRGVVAAAESAADIRALRVDMRGLVASLGVTQ
jgi:hypothetical protein